MVFKRMVCMLVPVLACAGIFNDVRGIVHDPDHRREDQEDEDSENGQHSDQSLCLCGSHVTTVAPQTPDKQWQDCRTPSIYCQP